jgi:hypothetical protein
METKLGGRCPSDGRDWDAQCGRCGSSLTFESCGHCLGDGLAGHDCGEDTCCCLEPVENVPCEICGGVGGFPLCISSEGYCQAHPMKDREEVARSTPEWFVVGEHPEAAAH